MKHEKLNEALNHLDDKHICHADRQRKRRPLGWIAPVAAVLALAILLSSLFPGRNSLPGAQTDPAYTFTDSHLELLVAQPAYPKLTPYPGEENYKAHSTWWQEQRELHDQPVGYADNLTGYFGSLICRVLTQGEQENVTCSPLSLYMALAMLAETAGGESRQQLLDLLRAEDLEALRTQAQQIWKGQYNNDGLSTSILATSLWLDDACLYNEETADCLADNYFASVFRSDLGSEESTQALRDWLNEQTGGLLQEQAGKLKLDPATIMTLASTVFYQAQWQDEFFPEQNAQGTFHGAAGNTEETFMNRKLQDTPYYQGDGFGAVYLNLKDYGRMWLILPDEGYTPAQVTEAVTAFFAADPTNYDAPWANQKNAIINLSMPKFDVSSDMDLADLIQSMGVTDIFDSHSADFSPLFPQANGAFVSQIKHATRVAVDEKGVTAAAFTTILLCGGAAVPTEEIDFVLDRPFLFYIESQDQLPMFTGIVNEP